VITEWVLAVTMILQPMYSAHIPSLTTSTQAGFASYQECNAFYQAWKAQTNTMRNKYNTFEMRGVCFKRTRNG
jgi:hypothetical protein